MQQKKPGNIKKNIQENLKIILAWLSRWKIEINETKTGGIIFSKKGEKKKADQIEINGGGIQWNTEIRLVIDELLHTSNEHPNKAVVRPYYLIVQLAL